MHHFDENLFYYNCENKMSVSGGGEWVVEVEGIWRSRRKGRGVRPQAEPEWGWNAGKDFTCQC